jgi:hypothetical protein
MLHKLPTDVFRLIVKSTDPFGVETLVKTHPSLRETVLLDVNEHRPIPLAGMTSMNAYLFDVLARPVLGITPRHEIERRIASLLGPFQAIARIPHVVLAGGSLVHILQHDTLPALESDLDFFVYGTKEQRERALTSIMDVVRPLDPRLHFRSNVIDVFIAGQRRIQIVAGRSHYRHPLEVVHGFDLGHVQIFFDGESVYATNLAVSALRSGVTVPAKRVLTSDRVEKALARGFRIWDGLPVTVSEPSEVTLRGRFLVDAIWTSLGKGTEDAFIRGLPRHLDIPHFLENGGFSHAMSYGGNCGIVITPSHVDLSGLSAVRQHGYNTARPCIVRPTLNGEEVLVRTAPFRCQFVNDKDSRHSLQGTSHHSIITLDRNVKDLCDTILCRLLALEMLQAEHTRVEGGLDRTGGRTRLTLAKDVVIADAYDCPQQALPKPGQFVVCDIAFSLHHGNRPGRVWTARTRLSACFSKRIHRLVIL